MTHKMLMSALDHKTALLQSGATMQGEWYHSSKLEWCSQGNGLPNKGQSFPVYQMYFFAHAIPYASKLQRDVASPHNCNGSLGQVWQG